jgi:heptosyltransferase-2
LTRSLIIAPQWIGDAVMTEPLLRRLHARGEQVTVGALPWVAPVYRAMPQVAEVIEFPFAHGGLQFKSRRSIARQIEGRFDAAYVLPNSLKSALLPFLASIPKRVGYLGEARVGLLTHRLKNPKNKPPMVAFYSALSGEGDLEADRPQLKLDAAQVNAVLTAHRLEAQAYCVFAPGAEFGPAKRWPAAAASGHCLNLAGTTSLQEALCLIAGAGGVVSNDSGLMHVAAAFGVPQAAVFGSSSPLHTPPLNARASVLWLKNDPLYAPALDCAPCFERECPLGHTRCLNDIPASRVLAALRAAQALPA